MAYLITYLIDIRGAAFNQFLRPTHQADDAYFEQMSQAHESDLRDGKLPGNDMEFLVDLTGEWTLCKILYAYSWLLQDPVNPSITDEIKAWEQSLLALLHSRKIFRIDDFLLDGWNSHYDYLLVQSPQAVDEFIQWLQSQDRRHWSELTPSRQP